MEDKCAEIVLIYLQKLELLKEYEREAISTYIMEASKPIYINGGEVSLTNLNT